MALGKFSVGNCCGKGKVKPREKCSFNCTGGTLSFLRGTYKQDGNSNLWSTPISTSDFFAENTLPQMPLYYPSKTSKREQGKCYSKFESSLYPPDYFYKPADVVQWRLQDSNWGQDIQKGLCRSWVPISEQYYYKDDPDSELTPVSGINIERKPLGVKHLRNSSNVLQHLVFFFDTEPYLQAFYRIDDFNYQEIRFASIQLPESVPVCWDGFGNCLVLGVEEYPYILRYYFVTTNVYLGKQPGKMSLDNTSTLITGCSSNFIEYEDNLFYKGTTQGSLAELDGDHFVLANGDFNYMKPASINASILQLSIASEDDIISVPISVRIYYPPYKSTNSNYKNTNFERYSNGEFTLEEIVLPLEIWNDPDFYPRTTSIDPSNWTYADVQFMRVVDTPGGKKFLCGFYANYQTIYNPCFLLNPDFSLYKKIRSPNLFNWRLELGWTNLYKDIKTNFQAYDADVNGVYNIGTYNDGSHRGTIEVYYDADGIFRRLPFNSWGPDSPYSDNILSYQQGSSTNGWTHCRCLDLGNGKAIFATKHTRGEDIRIWKLDDIRIYKL